MTNTIQTIPLKSLVAPSANPRKVFDEATIGGLAQSIRADGLLQNLVVRKRRGNRYEIVSGHRRFLALTRLRDEGHIDADFPVPVDVRSKLKDDDALRLATVENVQREQLNPIDEAEAFAGLLREGVAIEDVAVKAGVSVATVKRRLALASLCDEAKAAVRAGDSLAVAEALTIGTHDEQRRALQWMESADHYTADDIRGMMLDDKVSVARAIFPVERYQGTFSHDLFEDDETTYFDDIEQFQRLQAEAVEELAISYRETALWVEVVTEWHFSSWQYDKAEEGEPAGVIIHFKPTGVVEVHEGLLERKAIDPSAEASQDAPAAPRPKPEYSAPMCRYIAAHKTLAVQEAVAANTRKAKEIAIVQMLNGLDESLKAKVHPALTHFSEEADQPTSLIQLEREAESLTSCLQFDAAGAQTYYRTPFERALHAAKDEIVLYEAVKALSDNELDQVLATLVAFTFGQKTMDRIDRRGSLFNAVANDLGVDMVDHWRPDETFLSKRTSAQLVRIAKDSGAVAVTGDLKGWKKAEMVTALVRYFQRDDHEGARTWLPEAMTFTVDENDDEQTPPWE